MDVILRSKNNPVNDMTTPVSGLINDLGTLYIYIYVFILYFIIIV